MSNGFFEYSNQSRGRVSCDECRLEYMEEKR